MAAQLSREEFMAFNEVARSRRQLMAQTFKGTHLRFGKAAASGAVVDLATAGKDVFGAVKALVKHTDQSTQAVSVASVGQSVRSFLAQLADVDSFQTLEQVVGGAGAARMVAEVTPVVGVVKSTYDLGGMALAVVRDARNLYRSDFYKQGFRPGAPSAAAEAIKTIIQRDLASHSVDLAQQAASTGLKIAGTFVDVGTVTNAAIGTATAIASLGLKLYGLGLQIKDMQAGNRWLDSPDSLSLQVFNDAPILGSYLLVSANSSDLINMFVADIGLTPAWKEDVERVYQQQMAPLLALAGRHVAESPLQLAGLQATLRGEPAQASKTWFIDLRIRAARFVGGRDSGLRSGGAA